MSAGQFDPRITTYFGDPVLRAGFMPVPHLLMRHYHELGLDADHAMFALQLMEITWDLAKPPNTMKQLAERMGVSQRTARRYSEYLVEHGLLIVYEQFEQGAQVENGYDLSPLFARLALLAPEPRPAGTVRERRVRAAAQETPGQPSVPDPRAALHPHPPMVELCTPPDSGDRLPPDIHDRLPWDSRDRPTPDEVIPAPQSPASSLKEEPKKVLKKHQKGSKHSREHGGGALKVQPPEQLLSNHTVQPSRKPAPPSGHSLRWAQPLSPVDVATSAMLLDKLGLHASITAAVAPTLAPAEVWALATYARAARLGPGWLAKQVYQFSAKQPQAADLSTRYDAAGRALAALAPELAETILDLADHYCPHAPEQVAADPRLIAAGPSIMDTARIVSKVMSELRCGWSEMPAGVPPAPTSRQGGANAPGYAEHERVWQAALARLSTDLEQADQDIWLQQTTLLDLNDGLAVLGTPNVFVRDEVEGHYREQLAAALAQELALPIRVEVVIDSPGPRHMDSTDASAPVPSFKRLGGPPLAATRR